MSKSKNYGKSKAGIYILITTCVMIAILGIVWLVMAFASPYNLAQFTYKLGLNKYSHTLYMRDYRKSGDINSLYMATNLSIKLTSYGSVVGEYELLQSHAKYDALISKVNENNRKLNIDSLTKSTLLSEDEYLKNQYVLALTKTNNWNKAKDLAIECLQDSATLSMSSQGTYLFGNLVKYMGDNVSTLVGQPLDLMNDYLAQLDALFDAHFDVNNEVESYALCNRIIKVGLNIISVNNATGDTSGNASVQTKINKASSGLSTLMG